MSAPLCQRAGCGQPVKFDRYPSKGPARFRDFCSRRCVGLARIATGKLAELRHQRTVRFYAKAIRQVVGSDWRDGDPVTLKQLITLARACRNLGWQTRNMRDEQRKVAA